MTGLAVSNLGFTRFEKSGDYRLRDAPESGHRANKAITYTFHYTQTHHITTQRYMHDHQYPTHDCMPVYRTDRTDFD